MSEYQDDKEIARLEREKEYEEKWTVQCQNEIKRLRRIVSEYNRLSNGLRYVKVEADIAASTRTIGSVMEEAWNKALSLDADELSFAFNDRRIIIKKEEPCS
jgi:hypothetical protein